MNCQNCGESENCSFEEMRYGFYVFACETCGSNGSFFDIDEKISQAENALEFF